MRRVFVFMLDIFQTKTSDVSSREIVKYFRAFENHYPFINYAASAKYLNSLRESLKKFIYMHSNILQEDPMAPDRYLAALVAKIFQNSNNADLVEEKLEKFFTRYFPGKMQKDDAEVIFELLIKDTDYLLNADMNILNRFKKYKRYYELMETENFKALLKNQNLKMDIELQRKWDFFIKIVTRFLEGPQDGYFYVVMDALKHFHKYLKKHNDLIFPFYNEIEEMLCRFKDHQDAAKVINKEELEFLYTKIKEMKKKKKWDCLMEILEIFLEFSNAKDTQEVWNSFQEFGGDVSTFYISNVDVPHDIKTNLLLLPETNRRILYQGLTTLRRALEKSQFLTDDLINFGIAFFPGVKSMKFFIFLLSHSNFDFLLE